MKKSALIFWGGWRGHQPEQVCARFERILKKEGFEVDNVPSLDPLADYEKLLEYDLIIPHYTMSVLPKNYSLNLTRAIGAGVGLAGNHGGMGDAFREDVEYQFMCGGQWVAHPAKYENERMWVEHEINVRQGAASPISEGIKDFRVFSEQYYMHIDPAVQVLATTRFPTFSDYYHVTNGPVDVPVVWTKMWGIGRVFYNSLGHVDAVFDEAPEAEELMRRGMLWAAQGKEYNREHNITFPVYPGTDKMPGKFPLEKNESKAYAGIPVVDDQGNYTGARNE
jgi:type 1 glutamine amidotransferase